MERWKDVVNYEGYYKVSNYGKIMSVERYKQNNSKLQYVEEKILRQYVNPKNGYVYIYLCKNGKYKNCRLHRLVAEAFIPNPNNLPQINHKDGNRANNHVENLEWCTSSYNTIDKYRRNGTYEKDKNIIKLYETHKNCVTVAKIVNMSAQGVQGVLKRNNVHIYSRKEQRELNVKIGVNWLDETN